MAQSQEINKQLQKSKVVPIQQLINKSIDELGKALPAVMTKERLARIALTTVRLNPKLATCNPASFLGALFQTAQLGLMPNVEGQSYIIPYGNEAVFQIGYKGYIELFYRHQKAMSLDFHTVCENDSFDFAYGTETYIRHKPALQNRGDAVAYYCVAQLTTGAKIFKVMTKDECMEHGRKHSKTFNSKVSPWKSDPDAMCKKTVLIQLFKLLPKSTEIQKAIAMDETIKTGIDVDMINIPDQTDWNEEIQPEKASNMNENDAEMGLPVDNSENSGNDMGGTEKTPQIGNFEPASSKSDDETLKSDILQMLDIMGESLTKYTAYGDYAGTTDINALKTIIGEGKRKSQLQVVHNKIKNDFKAFQEEIGVIDVESE